MYKIVGFILRFLSLSHTHACVLVSCFYLPPLAFPMALFLPPAEIIYLLLPGPVRVCTCIA